MSTTFQPHNIPHKTARILPVKHEFDASKIRRLSLDTPNTDFLMWAAGAGELISVDLETTGLDPHTTRPTLVGISDDGENVWLLTHEEMQDEDIRGAVNGLMASDRHRKVMHNFKFDAKMMITHYGTEFENFDCTYIMRRLLVCGLDHSSSLDSCSYDYFGYTMDKTIREEFIGNTVMTEAMLDYAAIDVSVTWHLYAVLRKYIELEQLHLVYDLVERPFVRVLAEMELQGVCIDRAYLQKLQVVMEAKTTKFQGELDAMLKVLGVMPKVTVKLKKNEATPDQFLRGVTHVTKFQNAFNVNSPKQVVEVLNCVGFELVSASAEVLEDPYYTRASLDRARTLMKRELDDKGVLEIGFDIISRVRDLRGARKALNAFIEPMQGKFVNPATGRIHCSFNQMGTTTGRLSCSDPNFQQMPSERKDSVFEGMSFRRSFVPSPGYAFISYDYQACELRIAAEISRDEGLLDAITHINPKTGESDPHTPNAAIAYNKKAEDVTKTERVNIKTAFYTLVYGGGPRAVAAALRIPQHEAQAFMDLIFANFPGITDMIESRRRFVREKMYCVSLSGRKRYFKKPYYNGDQRAFNREMSGIERKGQNTPIQATNADITKYAGVLIRERIKHLGGRQLLTVHDEIVAEAPLEVAEECHKLMGEAMLEAQREFLRRAESAVKGQWGQEWGH